MITKNTRIRLRDGEGPRVRTETVPSYVREQIAACVSRSVDAFFADPENAEKFRVWQAARAART